MNPSTAFATVLVDELIRCGLREAVIAPGSRSAPLAMALHARAARTGTGGPSGPGGSSQPGGQLRLHVRIDERSAGFLALGLAKASARPVAVVCTSGTAAAHFHAAVIEADEACVPLIVITADRPPELRGTGANQTIDQIKLYGGAVRWFAETGVPENRPGQVGYWRSLVSKAWLISSGNVAGAAGPVHLNVPLREPLVPDGADSAWYEPLDGRPSGAPWTTAVVGSDRTGKGELELDPAERGIVVCGDGTRNPAGLAQLAEAAGWPLLAEPSSGARAGRAALTSYQYLLESATFLAAHKPDVIVSAGRPGLSRGQLALLRGAGADPPPTHIIVGQAGGRWADPARSGSQVAGAVRLRGRARATGWLDSWLAADTAVRRAADDVLESTGELSEPLLAREVAAALAPGSLLWTASSMPARDLDRHMTPRPDIRVLANRGTSGIDGLVSAAVGAALAHQADGGGPGVALLGDLALVHDVPGLLIGPVEPRPDLCLVVVNNDGGGIFSTLEQAAFPDSFERVFGTPHGADLALLAAAAGLPYARVERPADLAGALGGDGLRFVEVRTDRADSAKLRAVISRACALAVSQLS